MADRKRSQYDPKSAVKRLDEVTLLDSEETPATAAVNKRAYMKDLHKMEVVSVNGNMTLTATQGFIHFRNVAASDVEVNLELDSIEVGEHCYFEQTGTQTITIVTDEGGLTINSPSGLSTSAAGDILKVFKYASTAFNVEVYKVGAFAPITYVDAIKYVYRRVTSSDGSTYVVNSASQSKSTFTSLPDFIVASIQNNNTAGAPTINIDGLGAINLLDINTNSALLVNDLVINKTYLLAINNTSTAYYVYGIISTQKTGTYNYQDTATAGTPISLSTGVWADMTNNGAGALTLKFLASGKADLWNTGTNRFDFTGLSLGSHVHIRSHVTVTTTTVNQIVKGQIVIGVGVTDTPVPIFERLFKTAGTYDIATTELVTILTAVARDNPARLQVQSDASATVIVRGWNCGLNIY